MALFTTKAGGQLARFIFGGSRAGSTRWRMETVGRMEDRNVVAGFMALRILLGFLGGNLTMSATALRRAWLSGLKSGNRAGSEGGGGDWQFLPGQLERRPQKKVGLGAPLGSSRADVPRQGVPRQSSH